MRCDADGAVEHAACALVVVVSDLGDLVADPKHPAADTALGQAFPARGEPLLQQKVEGARAGRAAVHRRQHLDVATWAEAEPVRDAGAGKLHGELRGLLGVVAREEEEVAKPVVTGGMPALMRCAFMTTPDCWACRNTWVRRTRGIEGVASRSRNTSPGPTDGSWLTSPTNRTCAPLGTARISLFAKIKSNMDASSTTSRSTSSGLSRSKLGSPPGRS